MFESDREKEEASRQFLQHFSAGAAGYRDLFAPVLLRHGAALLERLPLTSSRAVLDLGTGAGLLLNEIRRRAPGALVVGADPAAGMIALVPPDFSRLQLDSRRLPFAPASFDAVTLVFVLFLLPDPRGVLAEIRRVLRPAGVFGIVTYEGDGVYQGLRTWFEELAARTGFSRKPWPTVVESEEELRVLCVSSGFEIEQTWAQPFAWRPDHQEFLRITMVLNGERIAGLGQAERADFERAVRTRITALPRESLHYRRPVLCAVARVPV